MYTGKTEKFLANEIAEHELKVEQLVCAPLSAISEADLPAIMKAKKQLNRLLSEKESATSRYNVSYSLKKGHVCYAYQYLSHFILLY